MGSGVSSTTVIIVVTVVIVVVMIGEYVARIAMRNRQFNKLQRLLADQDYEAFRTAIDSRLSRWVFPAYNRTYFKLSAAIMQDDFEETYRLLDELLQARVNKEQRTDLVYKAFNIYISQEDKKNAAAMLKEIKTWEDEKAQPVKRDCIRTYDIVILKKSDHIKEMKEELEGLSGQARGHAEHLIALQYENLGDTEKRDEYLRRAMDDSFTSIAPSDPEKKEGEA